MDTPQKVPVSILASFPGAGNATSLNRTQGQQPGAGRVHGPERGYVLCERRYLASRRRTQTERVSAPGSMK